MSAVSSLLFRRYVYPSGAILYEIKRTGGRPLLLDAAACLALAVALTAATGLPSLAWSQFSSSDLATIFAWCACLWWFARKAMEVEVETVTVMPKMGILLEGRARSGRWAEKRFLALESLASPPFINEGMTTDKAFYFLAFELHDREREGDKGWKITGRGAGKGDREEGGSLAVAFPHLLPPVKLLQPIYKELISCLGMASAAEAAAAAAPSEEAHGADESEGRR